MSQAIDTDPRAAWRGLLRFALIVLIGVGVLVHVLTQLVIPPVLVFMVLFGVVLFLLTREGRARTTGVVMGGVLSLLFLLGNLPFVIEDIVHPESMIGFVISGAGVVGALLGPIGMLGALRGWATPPVRPLTIIGAAIIGLFAVVGIVAMLTVDSDTRQEGDVALVAKDVDFTPATLEIDEGGAVFVENKDLFRHTFAIEELDIEVELPANVERRIVIDAPAGDYEFFCSVEGHEEDMSGTLTVR